MQRVRNGEIRWIVIGGSSGGPQGMQSSNTALTAWVKQHGTAITGVSTSGGTLYELS
jgi:hypothetical protein